MMVRAIPVLIGVLYWVSQLMGSICAAGLYLLTLQSAGVPLSTLTPERIGLRPSIGDGGAFFVQFVVSFFLFLVVLATGVDSKGGEPRNFLAALPIGIAVGVGIVVAAPLIGGSMNPAGAFGMILLNNAWEKSWIYLAGPPCAAIVVGLFYKFVFMSRTIGMEVLTAVRDALRFRPHAHG